MELYPEHAAFVMFCGYRIVTTVCTNGKWDPPLNCTGRGLIILLQNWEVHINWKFDDPYFISSSKINTNDQWCHKNWTVGPWSPDLTSHSHKFVNYLPGWDTNFQNLMTSLRMWLLTLQCIYLEIKYNMHC